MCPRGLRGRSRCLRSSSRVHGWSTCAGHAGCARGWNDGAPGGADIPGMNGLPLPLVLTSLVLVPDIQPKTENAVRCVEFATDDRLEAGESFTAALERS